ncbi:hypothetical protein [Legionella fairfieldensis]
MKDPLSELEASLAYVFELQETGTGKYINPLIQQLKKNLEHYKKEPGSSLGKLVMAIKKALPIIENYVDAYAVKIKMEALAAIKGEAISWGFNSSSISSDARLG